MSKTEQQQSKRIPIGTFRYVEVPLVVRPSVIPQADWDRLSQINNYIIDHVSYDRERASGRVATNESGVQAPVVTLRRGKGVCMDYAALFEAYARKYGYTTASVRSDTLNHSWNRVRVAEQWWIVDVTWNDGEILSSGEPVPEVVRRDADFRKMYFLTTLEEERQRCELELIHWTHDVPDATPVDYEKTLEATAIVDRISVLLRQGSAGNTRQITDLYAQYQRLAEDYPLAIRFELHGA